MVNLLQCSPPVILNTWTVARIFEKNNHNLPVLLRTYCECDVGLENLMTLQPPVKMGSNPYGSQRPLLGQDLR